MKRFFKYTLSLLLVLLLLLCVLDVVYTAAFKNAIPRNKLKYTMQLKNESYDVVFFGSSRAANTVNTKVFLDRGLKAINLGEEGAVLQKNLLLLKLMVHNKVKINHLFLQLDYLYNMDDDSKLSNVDILPYIRDPFFNEYYLDNGFENYGLYYYVPFYRYAVNEYKIGFREFFMSTIGKKPVVNLDNGYSPKYGKARPKLRPSKLPKEIKENNKVVEEFINICERENINLVFFTAPYCNQLQDNNYLNKLSNKVPNYHDFSGVISDETNFYDCAHLNDSGATLFTEHLYEYFFNR